MVEYVNSIYWEPDDRQGKVFGGINVLRRKRGVVLFLVIVTGAIVGGMIGDALQASQFFGENTKFLIQRYEVFSLPPATLDFYVMKISAGFDFRPNLVSILGMIIALFILDRV